MTAQRRIKRSKPKSRLLELQKEYSACKKCKLHPYRGNIVFGRGLATRPDVMAIAEAPGAQEDEAGIPLVGAAGQLFWNLLIANGINAKRWYATNMLLCRPPGNRNPHSDELRACRDRLRKQIMYVNPRVILLVGGFAMKLMGTASGGVAANRGRAVDVEIVDKSLDECKLYPAVVTWHPSYLIRTGSRERKRQFIEDTKLAVTLGLEDDCARQT